MKNQGNNVWIELTAQEEAWKKHNPSKVITTLKGEKLKNHSDWRKERGFYKRRKPWLIV